MTDKMREEFEAWVLSEYPNQSLDRFNPLHGVTEGEYQGFTVQHCWLAWKASRADLVIGFPNLHDDKYQEYFEDVEGGCFNATKYLNDLVDNIKAQGLKVTP
jgi:hypothetical protein